MKYFRETQERTSAVCQEDPFRHNFKQIKCDTKEYVLHDSIHTKQKQAKHMDLRDVRTAFAFGRRGDAWCSRDLGIFHRAGLQGVCWEGHLGIRKEHSQTAAVVLGGEHLDGGRGTAWIKHHRAVATSKQRQPCKTPTVPVTGHSQACQPLSSLLLLCGTCGDEKVMPATDWRLLSTRQG